MMSSLFYAHPNSPVALFSSTARIKALRTFVGSTRSRAGSFTPPGDGNFHVENVGNIWEMMGK